MSLIASGLIIGAACGMASSQTKSETRSNNQRAIELTMTAYNMQAKANKKLTDSRTRLDNSFSKVINRKHGILQTSFNDFIKLYEVIIKIDFSQTKGMNEINSIKPNIFLDSIKEMCLVVTSNLPKATVVEILLDGLFYGAKTANENRASEQNLDDANRQLRSSKVEVQQIETMIASVESIQERCDNTADLLANLNLLFVKSIQESKLIIREKGKNKNQYTEQDKKTLMTCINLADAIKKIIDVPLFDENNEVSKISLDAINTGQEYLGKLKLISKE